MPYASLHTHSHYSLLDAAMSVKSLVQTSLAQNLHAVALTDHGNMFGAVDFVKESEKAGLKPIVGCEAYVAVESRHDRQRVNGRSYYHLVLLAKNEIGYRNLVKLSSLAYTEGFYFRPRIDQELLREYHEGLIALSACISGEIPQLILNGNLDTARDVAKQMVSVFGEDNYFLEIQNHSIDEETIINPAIAEISKDLSIPLVATNDCHYALHEDHSAHDLLLCIGEGKRVVDDNRKKYPGESFYIKSEAEMKALFKDFEHAVEQTAAIADACDFTFASSKYYIPPYKTPEDQPANDYLEDLSRKGAQERYGDPIPDEVEKRLAYELGVIQDMKFADYFLIVWDVVNYAKAENIAVGPGRGSAAGSLVAYCLGITNVDPIEYDLLFERFLNPERQSMPDIDIDFEDAERHRIYDYVKDKYGEDRVSKIIAFNSLKARQALHDVGRSLGVRRDETDKLANFVDINPTKPLNLTQTLEAKAPLRELLAKDERYRKVWNYATRLEGLVRHSSIHPAGVVIGDRPLDELLPIFVDTRTKERASQYEGKVLDGIGILKMDFLGLKNLTVIKRALTTLKKNGAPELDMDRLPLDDQPTFQLLQRGETVGVFQMESEGMRNLLTRLKADSFGDISACIALYRPGPLNSGFSNEYVEAKHRSRKSSGGAGGSDDPRLAEILKDTYGVYVYQEQVMRALQAIGNFSLATADIARKAMGKKNKPLLESLRAQFIQGGLSNEYSEGFLNDLYDQFLNFGDYAFNKSHTVAYAKICYQTAYLKANFPVEYMSGLLDTYVSTTSRLITYIFETQRMGIKLLPPDVNRSEEHFTTEDGAIRYSLSAILGIGAKVAEAIVNERKKNGPYTSLFDFADRLAGANLSRKTLETLAAAGAFDAIAPDRGIVAASADMAISNAANQNTLQEDLFGGLDDAPVPEYNPQAEPWSRDRRRSREREVLGFYLSDNPLDELDEIIEKAQWHTLSMFHDESLAAQLEDRRQLWVAAMAVERREIQHKSNNDVVWILHLLDKSGTLECRVPADVVKDLPPELRENFPFDTPLLFGGSASSFRERRSFTIRAIEFVTPKLLRDPPRGVRPRPTAERAETIHMELHPQADESALRALRSWVGEHHGSQRVILHVWRDEAEVKLDLGESWTVALTGELLSETDKPAAIRKWWSGSLLE